MAQTVENMPAGDLGWEDPVDCLAIHSSIPAWKIPAENSLFTSFLPLTCHTFWTYRPQGGSRSAQVTSKLLNRGLSQLLREFDFSGLT